METNNLLSQGMDSDISKFFLAKDKYLQAYNFRATTELGESGGGLVNIRGNECAVKFPTMRGTYKLAPYITNAAVTGNTTTVTINGQTTPSFTINSSTTGLDIYNAIVNNLTNCYQNTTVATKTFSVAWKDDYVIVSQLPVYQDCTRTDSSAITMSRTPSGGAVNLLNFWQSDGTMSATQVLFLVSSGTAYITTNTIIGHTFILDDIYLFTADSASTTNSPVNDSFTGPGAIWKLNYNETTRVTTLTLMYYNLLDFNQLYPIAPSAATGRYESSQIQRIYWSDFYNKVRTMNVGDPQLMALNVRLLSIIPSVGFDIPIAQAIPTGSLDSGTYELCYRLKQSLGAISNYSQLSNTINLTTGTLHSGWIPDFMSTEGSSGNTGKGITWEISNIDTSFDIIEYVVLFRSNDTDIPQIFSVLEEPIPADGNKTFTLTSLGDATSITLIEFLTLSSTFTHAKTVDTKDNRLFWGNVKSKSSELNFDARAFRALTSNVASTDIRLFHGGVATNYTLANATNQTINPKTNDSINEYYDSTGIFSANACYYKPNTAGGILGGAGANISYEFGTYSHILDIQEGVANSDDSFNIYNDVPFRFPGQGDASFTLINSISNSASENQVFPTESGIDTVKHPLRESILRGFQQEEIYRFGFQAFDLEGNPYFTEWIADIKMPCHGDLNNNPDAAATAAGVADFRTSFMSSSNNALYAQTLYVKFTIDVSSIEDSISGYRIVRVSRDDVNNKTILGTGVINPTFAASFDSNKMFLPNCFGLNNGAIGFPPVIGAFGDAWNPYPGQTQWESCSNSGAIGAEANYEEVKTFDCFDFNVDNLSFSSGDRIFLRSTLDSINYTLSMAGGNDRGYRKWFTGTDWYNAGGPPPSTFQTKPQAGLAPGFEALFVGSGNYQSGLDSSEMPYYIHLYCDNASSGYRPVTAANLSTNSATYNKTIADAAWVDADLEYTFANGPYKFHNYGATFDLTLNTTDTTLRPCIGAPTYAMYFNGNGWREYNAPYDCDAANNAGKMLALYYRPNPNQYGGNTYSARAENEYIACGSYIPIIRDNLVLDTTNDDNTLLTIDTFGGDVYTTYWDQQKAIKGLDDGTTLGPTFRHYNGPAGGYPGNVGGTTTTSEANVSVTCFYPTTTFHNAEVRAGNHVNTSLIANYTQEDQNTYYDYHSNESDVVRFYPKPSIFVSVNEWVNRIYYSEVKFNNELQDSWQAYRTNNFYDVEGNYGPINCIISLKEQLYYLQERGFGYLYINPITTISGDNGLPVTLGKGATVEKHQYLSLDVGTKHQWSVYKSQSAITWVDVRSKKIYMFDGTLKALSDINGQRNFVIKRLHPDLIANDNPIIKKGIITTYDYYHNEFLYTFVNDSSEDAENDENYTLVYSEPIGKFTGLYSFTPPIYLNNNRYLFTIDINATGTNIGKIWIHNFGAYCDFYGTVNDSMIKVLVNDNPMYTKVFDNLSWNSQSIEDNELWIDDLITPNATVTFTASDNVNYIDDTFSAVRCYNEWENTDWTTLTLNSNLKKKEQNWSIAIPRNKVDYDTNTPPVNIFTPAFLTKTDFGERMRDKYLIVDLRYTNTPNRRFIVHNVKTTYRISSR